MLAVVGLGGCQVSTAIGVDARADGSGVVRATITLDRDAAAQVGDFASRLRVDDLKEAGWRIDGPTATDEGGSEVRASKPFATASEATAVVEELSGADGPFRAFRVTRSRSFAKTRLEFRGDVDLRRGLGSYSDDELRKRLGSDLGFDPAELQARLGRALSRVFPVKVVTRLPGSIESNAPVKAGNGAQWSPTLGEEVTLTASAEQWNVRNLVAAGLAVAFALALAVLLLARRLRRS